MLQPTQQFFPLGSCIFKSCLVSKADELTGPQSSCFCSLLSIAHISPATDLQFLSSLPCSCLPVLRNTAQMGPWGWTFSTGVTPCHLSLARNIPTQGSITGLSHQSLPQGPGHYGEVSGWTRLTCLLILPCWWKAVSQRPHLVTSPALTLATSR